MTYGPNMYGEPLAPFKIFDMFKIMTAKFFKQKMYEKTFSFLNKFFNWQIT